MNNDYSKGDYNKGRRGETDREQSPHRALVGRGVIGVEVGSGLEVNRNGNRR